MYYYILIIINILCYESIKWAFSSTCELAMPILYLSCTILLNIAICLHQRDTAKTPMRLKTTMSTVTVTANSR